RLPQAIALYIGAVLGAGILIVPGLAAEIAGPASLIDWIVLMIAVLPLGLSMAYLTQRYPGSGGVSDFVSKAFGRWLGELIGWFFLMSVPIGAPVAALTGAGYLSMALHLTSNMTLLIAGAILLIALVLNYFGMSVTGGVQIAVVSGILIILGATILCSMPFLHVSHFVPFMPHGVLSIGKASTLLFWCFIGWEAVSNFSGEFVHPEKDVHRATIYSAISLGCLYFLTAVAVIGTNSYKKASQIALIYVAEKAFGQVGVLLFGIISLLVCLATVVAYTGAASRLAYSLAEKAGNSNGLGKVSKKYHTPVGGLLFLLICFVCVLTLYAMRLLSLALLIQLPNATFLLNYFGGCFAGVILFKNEGKKRIICLIAALTTILMFLFVGWAIVYPALIIAVFLVRDRVAWMKKRRSKSI
ncbi:MAG: amino acid permease, partial [Sporolactobacillus sp.]